MRNLLTLLNDPDVQDYLGMLYANRQWPPNLYPNELTTVPSAQMPNYGASPHPNRVVPDYTGVGGHFWGRPNVKGVTTKRAGMTNREVDEYNRAGVSVVPRNVTRTYEADDARKTRAGLAAAYSPTNRSIPFATQVGPTREEIFNTPVPSFGASPGPGGPSVYEPDPYALIDVTTKPQADPVSVKLGGDRSKIKPGKGTEAEEGPSSWWDTALQMIQDAGVSAGDEKGTAFAAGGGFVEAPDPFMTGPNSIMTLAPNYLRKKKED